MAGVNRLVRVATCRCWRAALGGALQHDGRGGSSRSGRVGLLAGRAQLARAGVGSALLELAGQLALERGVSTLGLGVAVDNARAVALYRRLGFDDTGLRFTDAYSALDADGDTYDAVEQGMYMLRTLTPQPEGTGDPATHVRVAASMCRRAKVSLRAAEALTLLGRLPISF